VLARGELEALAREAKWNGYAIGRGTLATLRLQATQLKWRPEPVRTGAAIETELRPSSKEEAHPRSLSALVGLEEQPLHTDGAHKDRPPDIIVLHSSLPSRTGTMVWAPGSLLHGEALRHGIFLVGYGRESFFAPAVSRGGHLRYDPGCMWPCDDRATAAAAALSEGRQSAIVHEWTEPDMLLVIDNRRALHGRRAVETGDTERVLNRVAYRLEDV
jgi:alpha-ketoglutarate-dependent taurine dioxygenase